MTTQRRHRTALIMLALVVLAITTGAAASARWPATEAAYIQEAGDQLATLRQAAAAGQQLLAGGDGDGAALVADIDSVITYFDDNQAPPKLAPVGLAGHYAAQVCRTAVGYFSELPADAASNPFGAPMLFSMATNCQAAIQAADMEIARAVVTFGAYPPKTAGQ